GRARQAGFAVARRVDVVAFAHQPIAQRQPQAGFVFDDEDARVDRHQPAGAACPAPGLAGSSTTMIVPSPTRLSTEIDPPCASTTCRTTLRPTPVPRTCASRARRPR